MVQNVTIPLSWANNIPGVSGVNDVQFDVPEVDDIVDPIEQAIPEIDDIEQAVDSVVADPDFVADIVAAKVADEVEDVLQNIPFPGIDVDQLIQDIVDGVVQQVPTLQGPGVTVDVQGVFGPIASDIEDALVDAIQQLTGLPADLPQEIDNLAQGVSDIIDKVDNLDVPTLTEIEDSLEDALEDAVDAFTGGDLLTDPDDFIDDQIDRVTNGLVDPGVQQDLEDLQDDLQDIVDNL